MSAMPWCVCSFLLTAFKSADLHRNHSTDMHVCWREVEMFTSYRSSAFAVNTRCRRETRNSNKYIKWRIKSDTTPCNFMEICIAFLYMVRWFQLCIMADHLMRRLKLLYYCLEREENRFDAFKPRTVIQARTPRITPLVLLQLLSCCPVYTNKVRVFR